MDKINKIKIKDVTYEIGGGGSATVDSGLSTTSENAVQNKVITSELEKKLDKSNFQTTINSVVVTYENFGGADTHGTVPMLHIKDNLATSAVTEDVKDIDTLCKIVGYTGSMEQIHGASTALWAVFKASDLEKLKTNFTNGKTFMATICMNPSSAHSQLATNILEDLASGESMLGKTYIKSVTDYDYVGSDLSIIRSDENVFDATFESLYATYSGDTSTMFCAYWGDIRDAFKTSSSPSFAINGGSDTSNIYIHSTTMVRYRDMNDHYGRDKEGYYVKFIDKKDLGYQGENVDINSSLDYLYNAGDFANLNEKISNNKSDIGYLEKKVVYAEPRYASSAYTFTKTINGEKLYTTDNANRDIKLVTSVNGKTGAVNIQAKTINGESVLGEGEIDMSSYQTKTEAVKIARMTQAEYDALSTKDNNTLYIITDAQ